MTLEGYKIPRDSFALANLTGFMQVFATVKKASSFSFFWRSILLILSLWTLKVHQIWKTLSSTWMNSQPGPGRVGAAPWVQTWKVVLEEKQSVNFFLKVPWKVWGRCPLGQEGAVCSFWIWASSLHGGGACQGHPPHLLCHPRQAAQVICLCQGHFL